MSRKKVEIAIVKAIGEKLAGSFEKTSEDFSSKVGHDYFTFTRHIPGSAILVKLRFVRPNVLGLDATLQIKNKQIEAFLLQRGADEWASSAVGNDLAYIIWRGKHPIRFTLENDGGGVDNIDIDAAASKIVERFFKFVLSIESNLDSLEKLNEIFHSNEIVSEERIFPLYYCSPMQHQILVGLALIELLKPSNYNFILSQYEKYITAKFIPGQDDRADLALRIINEFKSRS